MEGSDGERSNPRGVSFGKGAGGVENETIAVIGYGVQGRGQSLSLRDNGFNVIVGQRKGGKTWEKAVADGWVPEKRCLISKNLPGAVQSFSICFQTPPRLVWPTVKKHLTAGKALYFSHGFGITYKERTGIVPPADVDVILVAPKGSGHIIAYDVSRRAGLNSLTLSSRRHGTRIRPLVIALGIGVGSGYLFETTSNAKCTLI